MWVETYGGVRATWKVKGRDSRQELGEGLEAGPCIFDISQKEQGVNAVGMGRKKGKIGPWSESTQSTWGNAYLDSESSASLIAKGVAKSLTRNPSGEIPLCSVHVHGFLLHITETFCLRAFCSDRSPEVPGTQCHWEQLLTNDKQGLWTLTPWPWLPYPLGGKLLRVFYSVSQRCPEG